MKFSESAPGYYKTTEFTPYYFADIAYNVVARPRAFARNLEDIFGDMSTEILCSPFPANTNLHYFLSELITSLFFERDPKEDSDLLLSDFIKHCGLSRLIDDPNDWEELVDISHCQEYTVHFGNLVEEVFSVLFLNIGFLQKFNQMTAIWVSQYGCDVAESDRRFTRQGRLRRVKIPQYVKDAVYHRDKGKCRSCKMAIDRIIRKIDKEYYDHIVPLAAGGSNDTSNLQLLCKKCNLNKSDKMLPASPFYEMAVYRSRETRDV